MNLSIADFRELIKALESGVTNPTFSSELEDKFNVARHALRGIKSAEATADTFFASPKWVVRYQNVKQSLISVGQFKISSDGTYEEIVPFAPYTSIQDFCDKHPEYDNDLIVGLKGVAHNGKTNGIDHGIAVGSDGKVTLPVLSMSSYSTESKVNIAFGYSHTTQMNHNGDKVGTGLLILDKVV